jgi:hypothetical protein
MRITILIFFLFVANLNAQNKYTLNVGEIKQKKYHTTFDFENVKGKIIIDVKINNKIRKFILDTGAPTSISAEIKSEGKFKQITNSEVKDANGKSGNIDAIQIPEFSINGLVFLNNYALQIEDMSFFKCFNVEGIIGSNSLRNSVIEFNFKAKKITISSNYKSFEYGKIKENELIFKDFQSTPILKVKMKLGYLNFSEEVVFDSGDDSFYSISTNNLNQLLSLINEKKMPEELQNISQSDLLGIIASSNGSFSMSLFGNETDNTHYKFKIQDFAFGTTNFDNIIATSTYGNNSRIGSEILNHGKLTLDYKKKKFYFQEYDNQNEINVNHTFKSIFPSFENDKFIVGIIWDGNLKDKIKVGDEILKVNNIEFNKLTKCQIMRMSFDDFKDFDNLKVELKDKETNEIKIVEIQN